MANNAPLPSSFDNDKLALEITDISHLKNLTAAKGCALTCYALLGATRSIRAGDHATTNRMFRFRIYAQGFTLLCIVAGSVYYKTDRQKRKAVDTVVAEQKAKEKNQAWIRELEARDREDKDWKVRRQVVKESADRGDGVGAARKALEKSERRGEGSIVEAVRDLWQGRH
ncbi:MAG: Respiratory supercomplex factor 1, mitochondrial [Pycnora praestabilis]|nr:MAG: Respiratory supercomplex factor 1, mitochondrial [Pycnora praestabilis]